MKKLLLSLSLIGIFWSIASIASANTTSCKDVEFSNGVTACVNIENVWTDRRRLTTSTNNGSTSSLRCDIELPDSTLRNPASCNEDFSYDGEHLGTTIKLWIRYVISRQNELAPSTREGKSNSFNTSVYPEREYNFDNAERLDDNGNNNNSNGDLDNFYLTADDTTPSTSQYIDLTVEARDSNDDTITDYTDSVNFKVYYRSSSSSSWTQTTSSTYYTMSSSYSNGYDFTSSNDGIKTFTNLIKFNKNNYDYKVRVYDENDTSIYNEITFNVGSNNNNSNVDGFTDSELNTVESIYNSRDDMINNLENDYSNLRNSTRRQNMSDDLKVAMQEIIDDESNKTYDNFDDFYAAFLDWYRYTISIR